MAVSGIGSRAGIEAALGATYRRYAADAPRAAAAGVDTASRYYVRSPGAQRDRAGPPTTPAGLLGALIDRMGGALASRTKGAYVNLRV